MLIWLESRLEMARIRFARLREGLRRLGYLADWIRAQTGIVVIAAFIAGAATYLDLTVFFTPPINLTPDTPLSTGLKDLLPPILAFGGTEFTLLVSTWFLVTQFAGNRYQSAAVVSRLATDWSSALILRLIVAAIVVALYAMVVTAQFGVTPKALAITPMIMLAGSLLALLTFRSYGLVLFQPSALARTIRQQTEQRITEVASSSGTSRSVANHMYRLTQSDWQVWEELLRSTASRDSADHLEIAHQLAWMLMSYLDQWWKIDRASSWFPVRQMPVPLSDRTFSAKQLRHIFEGQALGSPWQRIPAVTWFQDDALGVLSRAAVVGEGQPRSRLNVVAALGELLVFAWQRQEMAILAEVERLWARERRALPFDQRGLWLGSVINQLFTFTDNVVKRRLAIDEHLPLNEYPDAPTLRTREIPALIRGELSAAAAALEAEQALASQIVTPLDALSSTIEARLKEQETKALAQHGGWAVDQLGELVTTAIDGQANDAACELARALCLMADRAWTLEVTALADAALDRLIKALPRLSSAVAAVGYETRRELEQQSRILALRAILARRQRATDAISVAIQVAAASVAGDEGRDSETSVGMTPPVETVVVIGGLAFATGEIRADRTNLDHLLDELRKGHWNLNVLAGLAEAFESPAGNLYGPGQGLTLEYHRFVSPLYDEVVALGQEPIEEVDGDMDFPIMGVKTKSEWLRHQPLLMHFGMSEAIVGFLRFLGTPETPTVESAT